MAYVYQRECPHCKAPARSDATVCPHCTREIPVAKMKIAPLWYILGAGLLVYACIQVAT